MENAIRSVIPILHKLIIWSGIIYKMIGRYIFDKTVTCSLYLELKIFLIPKPAVPKLTKFGGAARLCPPTLCGLSEKFLGKKSQDFT